MTVIDKILNEWSFRCHDGIVNMDDPIKLSILKEILKEENINLTEQEEDFQSCKKILKTEARLKDEIIDQIEKIYNDHPENQKSFLQNFRLYDINQENLSIIYSVYSDYFNIKSEGMGRGEVICLLGLKNSKSGGTIEKDLNIGGNIYDVKELSGNEFRTASGGYITNTPFKKRYDILIDILQQIAGPDLVDLKELNNSIIEDQIIKLITYYGETTAGNISEGVLNIVKNLVKNLNDYFKTNKEYEDLVYVKIGTKKFAIDKETAEKIEKGEESIKSINLGNELKKQEALLLKLKKHPWVSNPLEYKENLNIIWANYIKDITGLIIIDEEDKTKVKLYSKEDLINPELFRFRINQNQLTIKTSSGGKTSGRSSSGSITQEIKKLIDKVGKNNIEKTQLGLGIKSSIDNKIKNALIDKGFIEKSSVTFKSGETFYLLKNKNLKIEDLF